MKPLNIPGTLAAVVVSMVAAAPTASTPTAPTNPLADFPAMAGPPAGIPAFMSVDPDGVYRTYLATNGTVISAARLKPPHIAAYLDGIAPAVSASDLASIREAFSAADSSTVPDTQLLHPPPSVMPLAKLAKAARAVSLEGRSAAFVEKRQFICTMANYYCISEPNICLYGNCLCNGVICIPYINDNPP